jgi:hypothetical protein
MFGYLVVSIVLLIFNSNKIDLISKKSYPIHFKHKVNRHLYIIFVCIKKTIMPFFGTTMGNGCPVSSMWHDNTHALVVALIYTCAKLNIKKDSELPETDHHNRKTLFSSVLYAHNASFPPLARSPPHPDAILIGCIFAHLLPVIGFVVAWAQRPCMVAHPCLSPGGHLSLCSAGTKQKSWIILPWTACACIRPPAPHLHADFFFLVVNKTPTSNCAVCEKTNVLLWTLIAFFFERGE